MKKLLLSLMILYFQIGHSQCYDERYRYNHYNYIEVFNLYTGEYERFKTNIVNTKIEVRRDGFIDFLFTSNYINNELVLLTIFSCITTDSTIIYDCYDDMHKRSCRLIFGESKYFYELTIRYIEPAVVFKVKRDKYE